MRMTNWLAVVLVCVVVWGDRALADWSGWRGPEGTGIVDAPGFDPTLNQGNPTVLWKADIGNGYSAVSVADGKAYTSGWANGKETVFAFDAKTGDKLWSKSYDAQKFDNMNAGGPGSTPAVTGDSVIHISRDGKARSFNTKDGQPKWEVDLLKEFGSKLGQWGFAGSPAVDGNTLLIDAGRIVRLNVADGKTVWKSADFGVAYSTPVPFKLKGKDFIAAFPESGLVILDAKTGATLAQRPWKTSYGVNAATPIIHDDLIFISSGYNTGAALLRLTDKGLELVWEGRQMRNQMPTSLLMDGHLYGFDDKRLKCLDFKTGEEKWAERGLGLGTLIATKQGHLITLSDTGELVVAKATPAGFQQFGRAKVIDETNVWTAPTLVDGRLYCRGSRGTLVCLDVSGGQ